MQPGLCYTYTTLVRTLVFGDRIHGAKRSEAGLANKRHAS